MTGDQFEALATLIRLRVGAQRDAARSVLVEGAVQVESARKHSIAPSALGNTLRACRKAEQLAKIVAGITPDA